MRKLLGRFSKWLYLKYGTGDINDLIKERIKLATKPINLDEMDSASKRAFGDEVIELQKNKAGEMILNALVAAQKDLTMQHGNTEKDLMAGKITIEGMGGYWAEVDRYVSIFERDTTEEEFDEHEVV